jgi:hypothetical protein
MEGPFGGSGSVGKYKSVALYASGWKGAVSPFTQVAAADFVSANSLVQLHPGPGDLQLLFEKGIALVPENDGGTVTIHALGAKPDWDMTIACSAEEVVKV